MDPSDIDFQSVRRLTRDEYHQLKESGLFTDERVELLHGLIIRMTLGPRHEAVVERLAKLFMPAALADQARLRLASGMVASTNSEPEPDLILLPPGEIDEEELPLGALLVIEVSDTSLRIDRRVKSPMYAAMEIAEYWIVSLPDRCIEVHEAPVNGAWSRTRRVADGERVSPVAFPDIVVDVAAILPKAR